ncbi:hypothetical protein GC170_20040 [bacterium]|nr:hypothetical protein [bacterium]
MKTRFFRPLRISLKAVVTVLILISSEAQAQDKESRLYRHLQDQAISRLEARSAQRLSMKAAGDVEAKAKAAREWIREALGPWPEKTPLNAKITGTIEGAGVKVEKVLFESRPGHHVTAALYLPTDIPPPWPGVIVPCGHSANGKAAETYQRVSILLARSGMAALCYDPIGQGERLQAIRDDGKPVFAGSTAEHSKIGVGSVLVGLQTAHYRVWDGIRALDYLESRPDILKDKLGCTGNSGGGTLTSFLMAVDDRIKVAAASCYLTTYQRLLATIGPQDTEQNIGGMIAAGYDHPDFVLARAPAPTLMCVATRDFFDIEGAWHNYRENKKSYGTLGYGERVDLFEFDDTHGFSLPRRQAAVRWLARWLRSDDRPITEPEFPIFTDAQLQVTESGQVLQIAGEKSVFALNAEIAANMAASRKKLAGSELRKAIRKRLAMPPQVAAAQSRPGRTIAPGLNESYYDTSDGFEIAGVSALYRDGKLDGNSRSPQVPTTVIAGYPKPARSITADDVSKFIEANAGKIPAAGKLVFLDVRGTGSSGAPAPRPKDPNGPDWRESELARLLGQNLVGLRTTDIVAVIGAEARTNPDIGLIGAGKGGIWALHAAALATEISRFAESDSPESWFSATGDPNTLLTPADVVPGVLADYDLEDLRRALRK